MEFSEEYLCQECRRTILKSTKRLHDLKFHPSIINNTNQRNNNINNRNLNERNNRNNYNRNMNNDFNYNSNINNDFNYNRNINIDFDYDRNINNDNRNIEDSIDSDLNVNDIRNLRESFYSFNAGLEDEIINNYPISKIQDINKLSEDKKKCIICLEDFKNNDDTIILPCIHIFHEECIKNWMKKNDSCPICKFHINTENNQ